MRLIHLTDPHHLPPGRLLYGINPAERLRAAVSEINTRFNDAAFLVVTGDLVHRGDPAAYQLLREILGDLTIPVDLGIGNHDDRTAFGSALPDAPATAGGFVQFAFTQAGFGFVMLDSVDVGQASGILCADRL
jgi:3',5'-cyclic AMP phosphodiesterase CpdA